ncbi:MAG: glycosyltransferase family 39 protein, partial [Flavobacteriales bacterium]|nr:glycosyltransferase family 39 protein [Flavobacteriales bacterium]
MHASRSSRWLLPALVVANLVLKLLWLGRTELAHDEPFTVLAAHVDWEVLKVLLWTENNPPLHFILTKLWSALVPLDEAWLRVPSAIFSALVVWPLFRLGTAFGGVRTGATAALLFTFSNYHYGFAHEVRAYALFTLLATAGVWQLWRINEGRRGAALLLALLNIAMVFNHFFGWLMVGLQLLFVLLPNFRAARKPLLFAIGATVLAYLPYVAVFLTRLSTSVSDGTWLTTPEPEELYNMIWRWSNAPVLAVALLLVIGIAAIRTRTRKPGMMLGLLWTFVPLVGMFLVSFSVPMFLDRYLVYAAPGFCLLSAIALSTFLPEGRFRWIPAAVVVAGMAITFAPWKDTGLHPSRVVQQVQKWQEADRPVLIAPDFYAHTFAWHLDRELIRNPAAMELELIERNVFLVSDPDRFVALDSEADAVILVDAWSALTDPEQRTKQHLRRQWPMVDSVEA